MAWYIHLFSLFYWLNAHFQPDIDPVTTKTPGFVPLLCTTFTYICFEFLVHHRGVRYVREFIYFNQYMLKSASRPGHCQHIKVPFSLRKAFRIRSAIYS